MAWEERIRRRRQSHVFDAIWNDLSKSGSTDEMFSKGIRYAVMSCELCITGDALFRGEVEAEYGDQLKWKWVQRDAEPDGYIPMDCVLSNGKTYKDTFSTI